MQLNRTGEPALNLPAEINILRPYESRLDNGLSIYVINSGEEDVIKFEIIFPTGATDSNSYMNSIACHQLADSGTKKKKAMELAEEFDFYGAFFQSDTGPDYKSFSLYSVGSLFGDALKIVSEILTEAAFPESELTNWKKRNIQAYSVNGEKVSWIAKKTFNETLFGPDHPYGFTPDIQNYESVNRENLEGLFRTNYLPANSMIILSGKITPKIIEEINQNFGQKMTLTQDVNFSANEAAINLTSRKIRIEKEDAVQSAIRIGRQLFSKNHPDYLPLLITNTILGGYFGSRLMSNIREDKGYTYGIGSGLHSFIRSGSFFIATEVGKNVCDAAIQEIYSELQKLTTEPVPDHELKLVKNYLFGAFQRSIDGPFELAERFKSLRLHHLDYDYFDKYLHLLNKITPIEIMEVAAKHLQPSSMTEVIAG